MQGHKLQSTIIASAVAMVGAFSILPASAGPVLHNGATFEVTATPVDANTASFHYTADFDNPAPGWIDSGGLDYIFAIDFKLSGYTIDTIDAFSTTASGGWFPIAGNTNANGCSTSQNATFACAWDDPFSELDGALTQGILTWDFTVTFEQDIDVQDFLAQDNHIGAFFKRCDFTPRPNDGDARECKPGVGLSQNVSFQPPDGPPDPPDPPDVPVPGTLLLLGLGLAGLGLGRRRG